MALVLPDGNLADMRNAVHLYGEKLAEYGVDVKEICHDEIPQYADRVDFVLFASEDECRAFLTLYKCIYNKDLEWIKWRVCKGWIDEKIALEINADTNFITEYLEYLQSISRQGVYVLNLHFNSANEHIKRLMEDVNKKYENIGKKRSGELLPEFYRDFFSDLYTEEYVESILNIKYIVETKTGFAALKDCVSNVYNVVNGERVTKGVPEKYAKTVYFVGPCFIYGHYVCDANTIESLLQKRLNDIGYKIKIVNCGSFGYVKNIYIIIARIKRIDFRRGDIIITYFRGMAYDGINNLDLSNSLKEVPPGWVIDDPRHCNHKVNALYADAIYNALEPVLDETVPGHGERLGLDGDFVKSLYIDRYFHDFNISLYKKIGAIVMNCNPFTYGHRHLIETALNTVEFLIIFVVEEDKSVFSFNERYAMVRRGTADLKNVMAVPSGPFILSQTTFPEYFIKAADEDLVENVENDITIFAEKIAPHLNIKYRFVGEEPEDNVTNEYNMAMKRILPKHGIELVEIPRKTQDGRYISASTVRRCLENSDMEGLRKLVPDSTVKVLFGKLPDERAF